MPSRPREKASDEESLDLLAHGELEIVGRMVVASNATLLGQVSLDGRTSRCIYKPVAGERPLWDFPRGTLGRREVAAYEVSSVTGWDLVPPTVWRDGQFGPGSVQLWVESTDEDPLVDVVPADQVPPGWLVVLDAEDQDGAPVRLVHADDPRLARLAVFDTVIDNADRKAGHILTEGPGAQAPLRGVDHGVSFNVEPKLRTILWGWRGRPLPPESVTVLAHLMDALHDQSSGGLATRLSALLAPAELTRTRERVAHLTRAGVFPHPSPRGPQIPWPPW